MNVKNTSNCLFMYQNESADRKIRLKRTFIGILNQCKTKKTRHEPCLHYEEVWAPYPANNFTTGTQILIVREKCIIQELETIEIEK